MIGEILNGYEIIRSLGAGGMGEVYLARAASGALRAVKIVRSDRGPAPQAAARFRREVLALGKLKHPCIVQIVDAGALPSGALYLAMEYVDGPDVQAAVDRGGPFSIADGLRILVRVAKALAYAHGEGVVHRDLKPANVILPGADPGSAKIIDFGLAKLATDEGLTRLTEDHQRLGSPHYWAPEQSATAAVGPEADIYALGGIGYFVLTGVPLFKPRPAIAMVFAHVHEVPESLAKRCPSVPFPDGLQEILAGCVAKAPAHRLTAEDLVIELEALLARAPSNARAGRPPKLFATERSSDTELALTNQIRQIVLELAEQLGHSIEEIDLLQSQVSDLELEQAMLDSEIDATLDPPSATRLHAVAATVTELHRQLATRYRALADAVLEDRPRASPEAAMLYEELDALFEQYRRL